MYCINCGVKLSDTEKSCPLCGTVPYHPDLVRTEADSLYPKNKYPKTKKVSRIGIMMAMSILSLIAAIVPMLCDFGINSSMTWSAFVVGAVVMGYPAFVLPFWFKKPNPAIFTAVFFVCSALYLLFINIITSGDWFLSFVFPTVGVIGLTITAVVTLTYYLKNGKLFVFGGAFLAIGGYMPLMELFLSITFGYDFIWWSLYPMVPLMAFGLILIFFGATPSAREGVERRFFL
ncbi:MAG: zinc ribbon domain-containing protein [Ruminococcaceae bacterium]|nr:zinc ribbon domain-containing protein [Oscillospiraceae bacterium]